MSHWILIFSTCHFNVNNDMGFSVFLDWSSSEASRRQPSWPVNSSSAGRHDRNITDRGGTNRIAGIWPEERRRSSCYSDDGQWTPQHGSGTIDWPTGHCTAGKVGFGAAADTSRSRTKSSLRRGGDATERRPGHAETPGDAGERFGQSQCRFDVSARGFERKSTTKFPLSFNLSIPA